MTKDLRRTQGSRVTKSSKASKVKVTQALTNSLKNEAKGLGDVFTDFTLGARGFLSSDDNDDNNKNEIYLEDIRLAAMYRGRRLRYSNFNHLIVDSGFVIPGVGVDEDGRPRYKLVYKGYTYDLALVTNAGGKSYYTIDYPLPIGQLHERYYEPFGFSQFSEDALALEVDTESLKLTNSSVLTKKIKDENGEVKEVIDEEGRNGKLLYTSHYQKFNINFALRDDQGNLQRGFTAISLPIVVISVSVNGAVKVVLYLPGKLGEYLKNQQNSTAKSVGYCLFTTVDRMEDIVALVTAFIKNAPAVILTYGNPKKYNDNYLIVAKGELNKCIEKLVKDLHQQSKTKDKKEPEFDIVGTKEELDLRRLEKEKNNEKDKASESITPLKKGEEKEEEMSQRPQSVGSSETLKAKKVLQQSEDSISTLSQLQGLVSDKELPQSQDLSSKGPHVSSEENRRASKTSDGVAQQPQR